MMLSTTVGAAFDDSSSVRTQACCRCAAFVGSIAVSYGLNPLLVTSNRDCGQLASTGAAVAAVVAARTWTGAISSSGSAAATARWRLSMSGGAVYTGAIGLANGSTCRQGCRNSAVSRRVATHD